MQATGTSSFFSTKQSFQSAAQLSHGGKQRSPARRKLTYQTSEDTNFNSKPQQQQSSSRPGTQQQSLMVKIKTNKPAGRPSVSSINKKIEKKDAPSSFMPHMLPDLESSEEYLKSTSRSNKALPPPVKTEKDRSIF